MEVYGGLQFEKFKEEDVDILTSIMKRAFDEDTRRHLNQPTGGPVVMITEIFYANMP